MAEDAALSETLRRTLLLWSEDESIPMDIHTACGCGDFGHVKFLLENGADASRLNRGGWTPLCYATFFGFTEIVEHLIDVGGAAIDGKSVGGITPLMLASACSNTDSIVLSLIKRGADLTVVDDKGRCALLWAVLTEQKMAAKSLLDSGANIENRCGAAGPTPLLLAVSERSEMMVNLLVQAGASMQATDSNGNTALDLANIPPVSTTIVNFLERTRKTTAGTRAEVRSPADVARQLESVSICPGRGTPELVRTAFQGNSNVALPTATREPSSPNRRKLSGILDAATADVTTVAEFLKRLKLSKYEPMFEGVEFPQLLAMDEAALKAKGLTLFGPRRKIFFAAQQWKEDNPM